MLILLKGTNLLKGRIISEDKYAQENISRWVFSSCTLSDVLFSKFLSEKNEDV
jgi:hypothetical protein